MNSQTTTTQIKLSFFKDWLFANRMAVTTLKKHPFYGLLLIICTLTIALVPERSLASKLVPYLSQMAMVFLGTYVITATYSVMRPTEPELTVNDKLQRRVVAISALYWTAVTLLGLLFVVPGVYAGIRACMSMQIASIEGLGVTQSINRSFELVKGHFRRILWYLGLGPLLPIAVCIGIYYLLYCLGVEYIPVPNSLSDSAAEKIADIVFFIPVNFMCLFWELSIFALMTKFYVYLINQTEVPAQDSAASSTTPKWNP